MNNTDEEIQKLTSAVRKRLGENRSSDYISGLQYDVLTAHSSVEKDLEERLLLQLQIEIPSNRPLTWRAVRLWSTPFMVYLSFVNKLDLVKEYKNISDKTYQKIRKLNTYRNEFAHVSSDLLAEKYNQSTEEGKNELIKLLSTLNDSLANMQEVMISSSHDIDSQQKIVLDSRLGVEERVVDAANYRQLDKKSVLKRITLMRDPGPKPKDALGDFVLSKELYIEVDENEVPTNPMIKDFLLQLPGWENLLKFNKVDDQT